MAAFSLDDSGDLLPDISVRQPVHCVSSSDDDDYENIKLSSVLGPSFSSQTSSSSSSRTGSRDGGGVLTMDSQNTDPSSPDYCAGSFSMKRSMSAMNRPMKSASPAKKPRLEKKKSEDTMVKQQLKAKQQAEKDAKREAERAEREAKKRAMDVDKQKKRLLQEARKQAKPGECLKHIQASIDLTILQHPVGAGILTQLQGADIRYEVREQPHPGIITFWREVTEVTQTHDYKLESSSKELVEDDILLYTPAEEFVAMVHAFQQSKSGGLSHSGVQPLRACVKTVKTKLEDRNITLIVQGMEKYFRDQKTQEQRTYRKKLTGAESKKHTLPAGVALITRLDVEEALVDVQLQTDCNIKFFEKDLDVAKCVLSYTKAVAEAPFKRERSMTGFSFHIDSGGSAKVDKDGYGLSKVWRQQIQQFKNVTAEVANAVMAVYGSPLQLYQAYSSCHSDREAELLLQDIEVRRGVGVMATTRRVGKELSRRFHQLMTATDGEFVIV